MLGKGAHRGTMPSFVFHISLTQHGFAHAAGLSLRCSSSCQCGHSIWLNVTKSKLHLRCLFAACFRKQ